MTPTDIAAVREYIEQADGLPFARYQSIGALLDELERLREEQRVDLEALKDAQELARELAGDASPEGVANALEMLWEREGRDACLRQLAYTMPALLDHVAKLREERDRLRALESDMRHAFGPNWGKAPDDAEATDAPRLDAYEASRVADAQDDADRELGRRVRESVETAVETSVGLCDVGADADEIVDDALAQDPCAMILEDVARAALIGREMASHAE